MGLGGGSAGAGASDTTLRLDGVPRQSEQKIEEARTFADGKIAGEVQNFANFANAAAAALRRAAPR